jgi:hypothetical protein
MIPGFLLSGARSSRSFFLGPWSEAMFASSTKLELIDPMILRTRRFMLS